MKLNTDLSFIVSQSKLKFENHVRIFYQLKWVILKFVFSFIVSVIVIDNQQDTTILIYLLLISSTCFGRCFRQSSGATSVDNSRCCSYNDMLLMIGENIVRNM